MSGGFKDMFSGHPETYARHRPTYPPELYAWIADIAPDHESVWDCATGSGQAAIALAEHFGHVVATDGSAEQLEHAQPHERVTYTCATAYDSGLAPASVDAVTVATAAHWFQLDPFYQELRRVVRPGGVCVFWAYFWGQLDDDVRAVLAAWAADTIQDYWAKEVRRGWDGGYAQMPFPFDRIEAPKTFTIEDRWSCERYVGFARSWSASQKYVEANGVDPTLNLAARLAPVWGAGTRPVSWDLELIAGRV